MKTTLMMIMLAATAAAQTLHVGYTNAVVFTTTNNQIYANGKLMLTAEKIAPLTVASNTASTFGQGAGLIRYDTNWLYLSVGTNLWHRVAVTNTPW